MADFRTILLNSKIQPVATLVFPVAFLTFAFTFTTERKKILPKLLTYHGIKTKSTMVLPGSSEVSGGFYTFFGTGPIFLHS